MQIVTAAATGSELGPLSQRVMQWTEMIERVARGTGEAIDWSPFADLVATEDFRRVGAYLEVHGWDEYTAFLSEWAGATRFETTIFRVSEVGRVVFQEIEERHYKGDDFIKKNVIAVYRFDDSQRICHLDIYEQAQDSGEWIAEAAHRTEQVSR